jgi:hypothetical protein
MMEFTVMGLYSFRPLDLRKRRGDGLQWSPYIGLGIGIASNNPKARGNILSNGSLQNVIQDWESLRAMNNQTPDKAYSSVVPVVPISLGVKTMLTPNLTWMMSAKETITIAHSPIGQTKTTLP